MMKKIALITLLAGLLTFTAGYGFCDDNLVVDENGNVGIGTNSPGYPLHIFGPGSTHQIRIESSETNTPQIDIGIWGTDSSAPYGKISASDEANYRNLILNPDGGRIGIGTTTPQEALHIVSSEGTGGVRITRSGVRTWGINIDNSPDILRVRDYTAGTIPLAITGNTGNVGIGTTNPSYKLDVNGTIRGNNVSPSDVRWKTNINTIENALEKVSKLRGVTYKWTDPARGEREQIGVIAQEVEKVFPQVVSTDSEGYKSVAYDKLVGPLIEAVKDLKIQNEMLVKKNENLEAENKSLHAQNVTMEQEINGILVRLKKLEN